jgi:hypothetical protein
MEIIGDNAVLQKHAPCSEGILSFSSELLSHLLGMVKSPPANSNSVVRGTGRAATEIQFFQKVWRRSNLTDIPIPKILHCGNRQQLVLPCVSNWRELGVLLHNRLRRLPSNGDKRLICQRRTATILQDAKTEIQ